MQYRFAVIYETLSNTITNLQYNKNPFQLNYYCGELVPSDDGIKCPPQSKEFTMVKRRYILVRGQFSTKWPCKSHGWMFFKVSRQRQDFIIWMQSIILQARWWRKTAWHCDKDCRSCTLQSKRPDVAVTWEAPLPEPAQPTLLTHGCH